MFVDQSMIDAFKLYFLWGIGPGSCSTCLLQGDYEAAYARAHPMIKDNEIWADHISFVETYLPECCRGKNFDTWGGYFCAIDEDDALESIIELTYGRGTFIAEWIAAGKTRQVYN